MNIINFIIAHQFILSGFAAAIIDFAWGMWPATKGNNILHSLYLFFKSEQPKV